MLAFDTNNLSKPYLFSSSENGLHRPWDDPTRPKEENDRALKAYQAVLTVTAASSSSQSSEYEAFSNAVKRLALDKFGYDYQGPVNNFVASFHDAVRKNMASFLMTSFMYFLPSRFFCTQLHCENPLMNGVWKPYLMENSLSKKCGDEPFKVIRSGTRLK